MPGTIDRKGAERSTLRPSAIIDAPGDDVGIAEPEEGQGGLDQDRAGDDDRAQRQHRRQRVGQHFAKGDLQRMHADDARRGDIVALADRQHLGARQPRRAGPGAERDGEHDAPAARRR